MGDLDLTIASSADDWSTWPSALAGSGVPGSLRGWGIPMATDIAFALGVVALLRGSVSACDHLVDVFHPWTSYVILPVVALAKAGIPLTSSGVAALAGLRC